MNKNRTLIRYAIIAVMILFLGALAGLYFFLRSVEQSTASNDTARGYGVAAPSFQGSVGSTYENVLATLGLSPSRSASSSAPRLSHISAVPVAGFGWVNGPVPTLYFVERSSGYVFDVNIETNSVTRLTDTLRPKTYSALFASDGSVVERSLDGGTNIVFAGTISTSTVVSATSSPDSLSGIVLPAGINALAVDPSSRTILYTIDDSSGASLISSNWAGNDEKHLFSSAITDWRILALSDGGIILLQKPADDVEGYAYRLQKDGSLSLIAQGVGLTVMPHATSTALIFGESTGGQLSLFTQMSSQASPVELSLQTIADKCAWAPAGQSPLGGAGQDLIAYCAVPQSISAQQFLDDWYKGIVHTSDQWWKVDVSAGTTTLIESPNADANVSLDVENPVVDPSGNYIAFMNAADQSLWVLRINQ